MEQAHVDLTLIDEMLGLSPEERLQLNDRMLNQVAELRRAIAVRSDQLAGRAGSRQR